MRPLIVIRRVPRIDFMRWHVLGFALSAALSIATVVLFLTVGLNYGIDFTGGTLIEVRVTGGPADLAAMRSKLDALHIGEPSLQGYVDKTTAECASTPPACVLIRLPEQPGGDAAQQKVVQQVRNALGPDVEYRRTEVVGPSVGSELIRAGVLATVAAVGAIKVSVGIRFEWQSGIGATVA